MRQCEYCERVSNQTTGENCSGCGAPVRNTGCAIIYDPRILDADDVKRLIGRPGVSIPINVTYLQNDRVVTFIQELQ